MFRLYKKYFTRVTEDYFICFGLIWFKEKKYSSYMYIVYINI